LRELKLNEAETLALLLFLCDFLALVLLLILFNETFVSLFLLPLLELDRELLLLLVLILVVGLFSGFGLVPAIGLLREGTLVLGTLNDFVVSIVLEFDARLILESD
jgi:hypothetical protein